MVIGPLTMNENGKIILLGLVSGRGTDKMGFNQLRTLYFRVATPDALKWIKTYIKKYEE